MAIMLRVSKGRRAMPSHPSVATPTPDIQNLLVANEEYAPPTHIKDGAKLADYRAEYQRSVADPDKFWGEYAEQFQWSKRWSRVSDFDGVHHRWFLGAKTNITINALDRHAHSDHCNRLAFIWLSEDGSERMVTYLQLYKMVCRFANGLKSIGVRRGDRVVIYMPLTIEGVVSMLACARIGAIHSVVYAGLGHGALNTRIRDAAAKVVIAGDVGYRRGKVIPLKSIIQEAIAPLDFVEKLVMFSRREPPVEPASSREVDFNALMNFPAECPAEEMDSEDPLFILYTSGTTGMPKGVVHVHGGYMVGTTCHVANFFDVGPRDIFWCTSDIRWGGG